ncbi:hypothetical protein LIER_27252 [Lithospermum erythrorhizon]|uniref:Peroxisomal membrane protein PEX16 n=1 Tax=Lithospermum erythrorhizon TaxID=34254 RepID=A0AAV3RFA3_LITER
MEAYKRWVRRNKDYVHSLESLANGLTWILPERFSESEIGPEAVSSLIGIITAINDHIIETTPSQARERPAYSSSFPYSLCITLTKDVETLVEVAAEQYYGNDKKWNFLAITEAIKVFIRLALFRFSGYKMLLQGGESLNDEKGSTDSYSRYGQGTQPGFHNMPNNPRNLNGQTPWNLEGRALSALNRFGQSARMSSEPTWLQRVQQQQAMESPDMEVEKPSLVKILSENGFYSRLFVLGETLFILRPLIYVLLIRKYGTRSWFPWFISLSVDIFGNGILSYGTVLGRGSNGPQFHHSPEERDELKRRRLLWALYLMRDPFFSKYTRQRLNRTQKTLEPVPIVGLIAEKLIDLIVGAQTRYTYMSGS